MHSRRPSLKPLGLAVTLGLLVVALLVAACAPAAPAPTPTPKPAPPVATPTPVAKPVEKLGVSAGLIYAKAGFHVSPWWIAQARGIFAKNGLDQKMTDFSDATAMMNSLGKEIDYATPSPHMPVGFYRGGRKDVRVIATTLNSTMIQFLVRADSPIKSPADLKGKKIGITLPGGSCHTGALLMLREAGIKAEEVTFITGGAFPELWTAVWTGATDAACQIPPVSAMKVAAGEGRHLWKMGEGLKVPPMESVLATTADVIKTKREALQRVVNSWLEADQWIEANREEAGKLFAQQIGIPEAIGVAVMTKDIPKGAYSPAIRMENLRMVEETMRLGGTIEKDYKIPWAEIVDTSFLPANLREEIR